MDIEYIMEEADRIEGIIGTKALLDNLEKAMGTAMLEDLLAYICRAYDIKTELKEKK